MNVRLQRLNLRAKLCVYCFREPDDRMASVVCRVLYPCFCFLTHYLILSGMMIAINTNTTETKNRKLCKGIDTESPFALDSKA